MADSAPTSGAMLVCEYCDVETQSTISARLLHALAKRCALHKVDLSEALKQLHERLLPPAKPKKGSKTDMNALHAALDSVEDIKAKGLSFFSSKEELLRRVSASERELDMSSRQSERELLAAELIRAYDTAHDFHCGASAVCVADAELSPRSAERHRISCIYRPLSCRNDGCVQMFSARNEAAHDAQCEWKMIACLRGCGENLQGDLEEHLESHVAHHLSLTMRVLTAQQRSLNDLQATTQKQAAVQAAAATQVAELADVRSRVGVLESRLEEQQRQATEAERELRAALQQNSKEQKSGLKGAHAEHERLASAHENLRATVDAVVAQMAQGAQGGSPQALR